MGAVQTQQRTGQRHGAHWLAISVVTVGLHYAWEMLQAPLFADFANVPVSRHAVVCLVASFGDLAIAAVAYLVTAAAFRDFYWALAQNWRWPAILWIVTGLSITIVGEIWATSSGRWSYGPSMPTVFGIGLSPLAQWVIVPPLTLLFFRNMFSRTHLARKRDY